MSILNNVLRTVFDLLLAPFSGLPPAIPVFLVSLLGGVFALLVFKWTSNQTALAVVKDKIAASFFEIRLFNDDLRALFGSMGRLFRDNLRYVSLNLVPFCFLLIPFFLLLAQLQFHYGYSGLEAGKTTLLTVQLHGEGEADVDAPRPNITLDLPQEIEQLGESMWVPSLRQVIWRIDPQADGAFDATIRLDGQDFTKSLVVGENVTRRSPQRLRATLLNQLLYPAEPPLPSAGPLGHIEVPYEAVNVNFLGLEVQVIILFFVLSLVLAFLLRKRLGVTI